MIFAGIDPGLCGAIAVADFQPDGRLSTVRYFDFVATEERHIDLPNLRMKLSGQARPDFVVMERVGAMPGQGRSSMFNFGRSFGEVLGMVTGMKWPEPLFANPAMWKRAVGLPVGADKNASIAKAIELQHGLSEGLNKKKYDGRAEALLLAYYGWMRSRMTEGEMK